MSFCYKFSHSKRPQHVEKKFRDLELMLMGKCMRACVRLCVLAFPMEQHHHHLQAQAAVYLSTLLAFPPPQRKGGQ